MMRFYCLTTLLLSLFVASAARPNFLTKAEKQAGWQLLFDGQSLSGWKAVGGSVAPEERWKVAGGWLQCLGMGGGDIITEGKYDQFELSWEWKIEHGGNSGLKYFVALDRGPIGHEYQLIDNERHPDGKLAEGKRLTAAFYDVLKCSRPVEPKDCMEVNKSRIIVRDNTVEHWLNGKRALRYELGSDALESAVSRSKFNKTKSFGTRVPGHLLLQDHQNLVWFRNIKIRDLSTNTAQEARTATK